MVGKSSQKSYLISLLITAVTYRIVCMPSAGLTGTWCLTPTVCTPPTPFTFPTIFKHGSHLWPKINIINENLSKIQRKNLNVLRCLFHKNVYIILGFSLANPNNPKAKTSFGMEEL